MLNLTLQVDSKDTKVIKALAVFFNTLSEGEITNTASEIQGIKKLPDAIDNFVEGEATKPSVTNKPVTKKEKPKEEDFNGERPTEADIRILVGKKKGNHRDKIKAELTRLGAENVSTLDEKHYLDFYKFLNDLD